MATETWLGGLGKAREAYLHDGGGARKAKEIWFHDGTAARKVFSGFTITNAIFSVSLNSSVNPQITFNTDGSVTTSVGGGSWGTPTTTGIGSGYWINIIVNGGTGVVSGGPFSTWLQLSVARSASITAAPAGSSRNRSFTYQISDNGGSTVIGGATFSLNSDR